MLGLIWTGVPVDIRDQDQVLRILEDAAKFLGLLPHHLPGLVAVGDVAHHPGNADGRARRRPDGGKAERDLDRRAVLAQPHRFVVLDAFTPADTAQRVIHLLQPVLGHEQPDAFAGGFRRRISEQAARGRIPAGDGAVERRGDDGVVRGFDRGAEQALAFRMVVARRDGAAVFLDFAFERDGFGVGFLHQMRERTRQHAGLAARVDRDRGRTVARRRLDRPGQLDDRPGQRSRDQQRQHCRAQHRDQSDGDRALPDRLRRRHDDGIRHQFDDRQSTCCRRAGPEPTPRHRGVRL